MLLAWFTWALLAALILTAIVVWVWRTRQLIAPFTICLATLGFYVLPRAAYLLGFGRPPLTSAGLAPAAQAELIAQTVGLAVVAVLAFLAGHRAPSAAHAGTHVRFQLPAPDPRRAGWIAAALWIVGGGATLLLLAKLGGLESAFAQQHRIGRLLQGYEPVFELTRLMVIPTALLLVDDRAGRSRGWVWLIAIATTLALFPLGRRSLIVLAAGLPIALYHLTVKRIPTRRFLLLAVAGAVTLFALSYVRLLGLRRLGQAADVFATNPALGIHFAFAANAELQVFDATTIVVRDVPTQVPYNLGSTIARVPVMLIPRAIWPAKPVTLGETIVSRYLPHVRTGYPPMATGDLYAAGGVFAVILGFACLGWLCRAAWEWYRRAPGSANAAAYLTFCFFVFDYTRVGDPSRTLWFFLLGFGAIVAAFALAAPPPALRRSPA